MKFSTISSAVVGASILFSISTQAAVVELGDLNIINDIGSASDGLRFLDLTYSDGLTSTAALANAQLTYSNARLATPSEFDDLFAAVGISYTGALKASDGFTPGPSITIARGGALGANLAAQLGPTAASGTTFIFTDPDGDGDIASTRDGISIAQTGTVGVLNWPLTLDGAFGWLLVSEASPIPAPAAVWLFGSGLIGLLGFRKLNKGM